MAHDSIMNDFMHDPQTGIACLIASWFVTFIATISLGVIPIILSSIASVMAIINYWYQIRKNRKTSKHNDNEKVS